MAGAAQALLEGVVILDHAIVNDGDFSGGIALRMGILSEGTPWVAQRVWPMPRLPGGVRAQQHAPGPRQSCPFFLAHQQVGVLRTATPALS
jgi:hypothetical protein